MPIPAEADQGEQGTLRQRDLWSWPPLSEQRAVPAGGTLHPPLAVITLRCLSFSGSLIVTDAGV